MFSLNHIISAIISGALIYFAVKLLKDKDEKVYMAALKIICLIVFLLNPINWIWEIYTYGAIDASLNLPLHICTLFWALFPFGLLLKKDSAFKQMALANCATVGLIGGVAGYFMNTHLNKNPFFSFPVMRSLLFHLLMVLAAVLIWVCGVYKPKKSDIYTYFIPVVLLVLVCYGVEAVYGYEYCFVRDGAGTPFVLLSAVLPQPLYVIVLYTFAFFIFNLIFYNRHIIMRFGTTDDKLNIDKKASSTGAFANNS